MTCKEFLALLDDLIDGTVTGETRADLEPPTWAPAATARSSSTPPARPSKSTAPMRSTTCPRPSGPTPRRHHGALQKRLLKPPSGRQACPPAELVNLSDRSAAHGVEGPALAALAIRQSLTFSPSNDRCPRSGFSDLGYHHALLRTPSSRSNPPPARVSGP